MSGLIMNTRTIAATLREQVKRDVTDFKQKSGITPSLVLIGVGEDPTVYDYIKAVIRQAMQVGIRAYAQLLPPDISLAEMRQHLEEFNQNPAIQGISLQSPLPKHLPMSEVASFLRPEKDVEGLHPLNIGAVFSGSPLLVSPPATSTMKLLSLYSIKPAGRHVVIIGRNLIIGKPLSILLTDANATVTVCHSQTQNLTAFTRQAEIVVVAVQQPNFLTPDMVRPGAVVIDYGINYVNGQIVGDVNYADVQRVEGAITPMPGGTGPLTVIALLQNVLQAAQLQQDINS